MPTIRWQVCGNAPGTTAVGRRREVSSSAWRVKGTRPIAWGARGAAATRDTGSGGVLARSRQRRLDTRSKDAGLSESDWVGTIAVGRAQFGAQCCFAIIHTLLRIQNTK
jgi:hypothetical protein